MIISKKKIYKLKVRNLSLSEIRRNLFKNEKQIEKCFRQINRLIDKNADGRLSSAEHGAIHKALDVLETEIAHVHSAADIFGKSK